MSNIEVRCNLSSPHPGGDSPLHALIAGRTRLPDGGPAEETEFNSLWSAQWWGLQSSQVFGRLSKEARRATLAGCNKAVLNEAYFIEKCGLSYTAKMVLTAASTDVAQLYALIGGDEARHLAWIEPYLDADEKSQPVGQFLTFLCTLIENVEPHLLIYLVQIILEGWGLDHYKRLSDNCQQARLAQIFSIILKDEALHHRSGELLFDAASLSMADLSSVKEALKCYAEMVRVGPQAAIAAIDKATGGLSLPEVEEVLAALRHVEESTRKLKLLKGLMRQPGLESIVDQLEALDCFVPMTVPQAARTYLR